MVARRWIRIAFALVVAGIAAAWAVPVLFERALRQRLADLGLDDVELEVASVGLDRALLRGVQIDGIALGTVELEPGLRLLWRDPTRLRIPDARASAATLDRVRQSVAARSAPSTARAGGARIELDITLRDPSPGGFVVSARGTLITGANPRLERGHVELAVPRAGVAPVTVYDAHLAADLSGSLSPLAVSGTGALRFGRATLGPLALGDGRLPFTIAADRIAIARGSAAMFGGTLVNEPFELGDRALVLHASALKLDAVVGAASPITGDGTLDGTATIEIARGNPRLVGAELHARSSGRLRVRDRAWRDRLAAAQTPLGLQTRIATALSDFHYETLAAVLAPVSSAHELVVSMSGQGTSNHQPIDLAVRINGARDAAAAWLGAVP